MAIFCHKGFSIQQSQAMKYFTVLSFLFLLPGCATERLAHGVVVDAETAQPISDARIYLISENRNTTSEEDGEFYIRGKSKKPLNVVVSKEGYLNDTIQGKVGTVALKKQESE